MLEINKDQLGQGNLAQGHLAEGASRSPIRYADALENFRRNTDWWVVADVLDLPNAVGSALWVAQKTGFSVEDVSEALEGLVVLGLLKKSEKGFEKVKRDFDVPWTDQSKQQKLDDHALISRQILNHLNESARGAIRFASFASNIEIIAEMYRKVDQALNEAQEKSRKLKPSSLDNVYLVSYTSVTATPDHNGGKGEPHA